MNKIKEYFRTQPQKRVNLPQNLESVSCNICSSDNAILFIQKNGYSIVKCRKCGLIYVNPRATRETILTRYSTKYFYDEYLPYLEKNKNEILLHYRNICKKIEELTNKKNVRVLEIGCGTGLLLHVALEEFNFESQGVEYNNSMVEYGVKNFGVNIIQGDINKIALEESNFDAIVMADVIEHFFDPLKTLKYCNELLADSGIIFLSTPNIDSKLFQQLGVKWGIIGPSEHLYYFNPNTIESILNKSGFSIVQMSYGNKNLKDVMFIFAKKSYQSSQPFKQI